MGFRDYEIAPNEYIDVLLISIIFKRSERNLLIWQTRAVLAFKMTYTSFLQKSNDIDTSNQF